MEYISAEHQKELGRTYKMAAIIVVAFCITVFVYMLVAKFITPNEITPGSESWMNPVYSAAIVLGLVVVVLRRIMLSRMVMGPAAMRGVRHVLRNMLNMTIICCVLSEIAAIGGLMLYLLTADFQYSWRLSAVSLFLLIYTFPRRGEWERAVAFSAKIQSESAAQIAR